jgi:cell division protein FtsA
MAGMTEIAEQVFELPVRKAVPRGIGGLVDVVASPAFATAVGLALWGHRHGGPAPEVAVEEGFSLGRLGGRVYGWLSEVFVPVAGARHERAGR